MSKYHPLDVRHPANRDLRSRTFLLDPPSQEQGKPARRVQRPSRTRQAAPASASTPVNPWGERGKAALSSLRSRAETGRGPVTRRRRGGMLNLVILIAVGVYVFSRPDGGRLLAEMTHFVTDFFDDILR